MTRRRFEARFEDASPSFRRATLLARFARALRHPATRGARLAPLVTDAREVERDLDDPAVTELVSLIEVAARLP